MTQRTPDLAQHAWRIPDRIEQIGELGIMLREMIAINRGETAIMAAVIAAVDGLDAKSRDTRCKRLK